MFKKTLSIALVGILSILTCFAQTASVPDRPKQSPILKRADFYIMEPAQPDFEKELHKSIKRQNKLSSGAKTALWVGIFAAGVAAVVILATSLGGDDSDSPCGGGVTTPCPPGCVCNR